MLVTIEILHWGLISISIDMLHINILRDTKYNITF